MEQEGIEDIKILRVLMKTVKNADNQSLAGQQQCNLQDRTGQLRLVIISEHQVHIYNSIICLSYPFPERQGAYLVQRLCFIYLYKMVETPPDLPTILLISCSYIYILSRIIAYLLYMSGTLLCLEIEKQFMDPIIILLFTCLLIDLASIDQKLIICQVFRIHQ